MKETDLMVRLSLSILLGGIIGLERELVDRPAGFRTHILVCLGSTVVMLVSLYLTDTFYGSVDIDPTRIPAQVISGIGFLGAGTIIIRGATVKGLTTAASLWTTAAIGLAIGSGFYKGAVYSTVLTFVTLITLGRLEEYIIKKRLSFPLYIKVDDKPGQIGKIGVILGKLGINIRNIEIEHIEEDKILICIMLKRVSNEKIAELINMLSSLKGVHKISFKKHDIVRTKGI